MEGIRLSVTSSIDHNGLFQWEVLPKALWDKNVNLPFLRFLLLNTCTLPATKTQLTEGKINSTHTNQLHLSKNAE